ncbi:tumor necrosis factor receptor superfamily member 9-like [Dunckerocampus dactyliophorus]|uniref:tumor necrosis factor receptor superfamily member 9-like n=1 Tax=Dunckerocampus dactyliophorus TaxID=161453 RepID=UPI002407578F|nr:tumor necrosis factor receptor superfamily member 9-like [Dunckerocampus dactyliophorus]
MAVTVSTISLLFLLLLVGGSLSSPQETERGCKKWKVRDKVVCCDECHPGNRLVTYCGANPQDLCTPCETGTFTQKPRVLRCSRCTQCEGAQVLVKKCTTTRDTQCGCKDGLLCGDDRCSFCFKKCSKGEEPTEKRSCRKCANGTFSDQNHQQCKPWSTKCPYPDERIVAGGDAFSDIKCSNISHSSLKAHDHKERVWPIVLSVVLSVCLVLIMVVSILKRKRKTTEKMTKQPIIRTPTDDPETLMATECSFHEAEEEQGSSSSESFVSKESQDHLLA